MDQPREPQRDQASVVDLKPIDESLHRRPVPKLPPGQNIAVADDSTSTRLSEFGLDVSRFAVLPRNFMFAAEPEAFVFEESTAAIATLGRQVGLAVELPGSARIRTIHEKDAEVIAPVLVVTHAFLAEGGAAIVVAFIERLARYVRKRWGPGAKERHVILELSVIKGKNSKRVTYSGPQEGLPEIVDVAARVFDE
jgi:hypothetical protein